MDKNKLRQLIREEIQLLNENMSGAIYHFTKLEPLVSMLTKDSFKLSYGYYTESELHMRGRSHYASFTTVRHGGVGYPSGFNPNGYSVRIAFDARKLGNNHKMTAVQWFDDTDNWSPDARGMRDENEVRVISNKKSIENINKYIGYIDIKIPEFDGGDSIGHYYLDLLQRIHLIAKKMNIKVRYFHNKQWNLGRKSSDLIYNYIDKLQI